MHMFSSAQCFPRSGRLCKHVRHSFVALGSFDSTSQRTFYKARHAKQDMQSKTWLPDAFKITRQHLESTYMQFLVVRRRHFTRIGSRRFVQCDSDRCKRCCCKRTERRAAVPTESRKQGNKVSDRRGVDPKHDRCCLALIAETATHE